MESSPYLAAAQNIELVGQTRPFLEMRKPSHREMREHVRGCSVNEGRDRTKAICLPSLLGEMVF